MKPAWLSTRQTLDGLGEHDEAPPAAPALSQPDTAPDSIPSRNRKQHRHADEPRIGQLE